MSYPFYRCVLVKKTRKPHRCIWCGEGITEGRPAKKMAGMSEGDFWSGYMHVGCEKAADKVADEWGSWEADQNYARGRTDDDRSMPPEFSDEVETGT